MELEYSMNAHTKMIRLLIATARENEAERFVVPLKKIAYIYDIMELIGDEEELEFVLGDIMTELSDLTIEAEVEGEKRQWSQNFMINADYPGDRRTVWFHVIPELEHMEKVRVLEAD